MGPHEKSNALIFAFEAETLVVGLKFGKVMFAWKISASECCETAFAAIPEQ